METIISARRVSTLHVFMADPPRAPTSMVFHKDKVVLCPHPKFLQGDNRISSQSVHKLAFFFRSRSGDEKHHYTP